MAQLKKSEIRTILTKYFDLSFPGSFQSIAKFQEGLERKLKMKVSRRSLTKILKNNAFYQTHVTRPKKFLVRKFSSKGCLLVGFSDPVYLQLPTKKIFKFLIVCDSASKYVYGQILNEVNPKELKRAFTTLFKSPHHMPYFPVLVVDKDRSLGTMARPFFASRHMLLRQKRGRTHMHFLEPIIRTIKKNDSEHQETKNKKKLSQTCPQKTFKRRH